MLKYVSLLWKHYIPPDFMSLAVAVKPGRVCDSYSIYWPFQFHLYECACMCLPFAFLSTLRPLSHIAEVRDQVMLIFKISPHRTMSFWLCFLKEDIVLNIPAIGFFS